MSFTVEVDDRKVQARFQGMPGKLHDALVKKTTVLRLLLEAATKAKSPVVTGALRRSIFSDQSDTATSVEGRVASSADVNYAKYVEYGTKPHDIIPSKAQALKFVVGGKTVFAKIVHHPGTKANPFFAQSLSEMKPTIVAGYREVVKEAQL